MGLSINGFHSYCGDYVYSGHTVILTMCSLIIEEYSPKKWYLLHWLSWLVTTVGVVFVMVAHGHYTLDVVIAYWITTQLFYMYHSMANNPAQKVSGLLWLHKNSKISISKECLFSSKVARTTTFRGYGGSLYLPTLNSTSAA